MPNRIILVITFAAGSSRLVGAQAPITRDSAGVHIVENIAPLWTRPAPQRLDRSSTLTLGAAAGGLEQQFGEVTDAVRLDNGDVVVADRKNYELRVFDATGHFIRTIGQRGEGPGDVQALASIFHLAGDVILMWDQRAHRLTWFGSDGTVRKTLNVDHPLELIVGGHSFIYNLGLVGPLNDGSVMAYERKDPVDPPPGMGADSIFVWHVDGAGHLHPARGLPSGEPWSFRHGQILVDDWRPFTTRSSLAAAPDGFSFSDGVAFEVRQYGADGKLRRIIRERRIPDPIMPAEVAAYKKEQIDEAKTERLRDESRRAATVSATEAAMNWLPFPARHAAFTALNVDPAGGVWTREDGDSTAIEHWDHFDRSGHLLGEVDFPAGLTVFEIGVDYVLGKVQDQDGVESVREYRLTL